MSIAAVQVEDFSFTYAGRGAPSLQGVSFSLPPGSWTVIAGGTGSGKSTLLRALAGLIPHHSAGIATGRVLLFDRDTRETSTANLARTVGLVLQSPQDQICTTQVQSEVAFGLENLATPVAQFEQRIDEALSTVALTEFRHRPTAELSGGQQQRVVLASVLALRPKILLLDEPFSQLDAESSRELLGELVRLQELGVTIVIAEHRLADVLPRADRVLLVDQGCLLFDGGPNSAEMPAAFANADLEMPAFSLETGAALPTNSRIHPREKISARDDSPPVLSVCNLSFRYPNWPRERSTLRDLSFSLRPGERVGLVGANGSGKSTLLSLLAGLNIASSGEIKIAPSPTDQLPLGMVLQQADLMLFCRTVREELAFGPKQLRLTAAVVSERVQEAARLLDLEAFLEDAPQALSQGQRLRVAIAATLTLRPRVLLLDEPTTGLDRRQLDRVMQAIDPRTSSADHRQGAVIFSTHDLHAVRQWTDRVIVMERGEIIADGATQDVLPSPTDFQNR